MSASNYNGQLLLRESKACTEPDETYYEEAKKDRIIGGEKKMKKERTICLHKPDSQQYLVKGTVVWKGTAICKHNNKENLSCDKLYL